MQKYDHTEIEHKWQRYWDEHATFKSEIDKSRPKYYCLDMFPYPSGSGLHVGHVEGYTATDIISRYKRMKGFNVLHPMGWDSFGLPAEQYAVRTGTHPALSTQANIDTYRRQLKSLGFSYDWSRELATSDPKYYKWTQWIFTQLVNKGLAYEADMLVNYCPYLGTVLANEEVENGKSKEGGHEVVRKPLRQWMLKITAYAERLISDLDLVDWPSHVKTAQLNWIGKSSGMSINFLIPNSCDFINVYTTRHDTLFGATYIAIAPEHPLALQIASIEHKAEVLAYIEKTRSKSDMERTELNKEKSGVFTGAYAENPANKALMPIWIADYVLPHYGSGAVMAVPGHDERDFEFAKKHNLPILYVVHPTADERSKEFQLHIMGECAWEGEGTMINSENEEISLNALPIEKAKEQMAIWLESHGYGIRKTHYKLRDWLFSRQRYWAEPIPILHFPDGTTRTLDVDELPLLPPQLSDYKPSGDGQSPLAKVDSWVTITDPKTGKIARRETNTMPQWAGSCWYYLRFLDPHNDKEAWDREAEKYWMPVDLYVGGIEHAVLHLLYSRFWHKVLYDLGYVSTLEPFAVLRNQGLIVARSYKDPTNHYVDPADVVAKDGKYFKKGTEIELNSQIEKMSKSKLNGIVPDDIIREFGADSLRLYEMFMGPIEKEKIWNSDAVVACRRFLSRIWDMVHSEKITCEQSEESLRLINRLIAKVESDMEHHQFNTAIAKMMEFVNDFTKLEKYPKESLELLVKVLSPFAPHIAEELWQHLGHTGTIANVQYPKYDPAYLQDAIVTYVVQVNGKLRARLDLPKDESEETIFNLAGMHQNVHKFIDGKAIEKVIFVPNKLLNIVVKD